MSINNTSVNITQNLICNNTVSIYPNTSTNNGLNLYCYPNYIGNTNGANYGVNLNVVCNTTGLGISPIINAVVADGFNAINTIITLACSGSANDRYYNGSRTENWRSEFYNVRIFND